MLGALTRHGNFSLSNVINVVLSTIVMRRTLTFLLSLFVAVSAMAQERLTKEQILAMSADQLSELPLEDLMQACRPG